MTRPIRTFKYPACAAFVLLTMTSYGQFSGENGHIPAEVQKNDTEQVEITSQKDNTLYESDDGSLSNGAGSHLFSGRTGQSTDYLRRALIWFDVASEIPEEAEITNVILHINVSKVPPGSGTETFLLHRVTSDWGEGASQAGGAEGAGGAAETGDATWLHRFYDEEQWDDAGGDFITEPSAETNISGTGPYSWASNEKLIEDVQNWLDEPGGNFGWIVTGNEDDSQTARRFDSRHHSNEDNRPRLVVEYRIPTASEYAASEVPNSFTLHQNHPNPFNPVTQIRYDLNNNGHVRLTVYSLLGEEIQILVDEVQSAGEYQVVWNTNETGLGNLGSGVYLYRLTHNGQSETRRMLLLQ